MQRNQGKSHGPDHLRISFKPKLIKLTKQKLSIILILHLIFLATIKPNDCSSVLWQKTSSFINGNIIINIQDLVFSVELHLGLILYPLTLIPFPLSQIPDPWPLIPTPCSLSPTTVAFKKFRWGFFFFFSLLLLLLLLPSKSKVNS